MKLTDSITDLKGIGPRKAEAFGKLGLFSMHDVLYHFPRKYRDYSKTSCIMGAKHGDYVALELKHVKFIGLHFHIGSQILDMGDFIAL